MKLCARDSCQSPLGVGKILQEKWSWCRTRRFDIGCCSWLANCATDWRANKTRYPASLRYTSLHFTSLHFTSRHVTSRHFTSRHFTSRQWRDVTWSEVTWSKVMWREVTWRDMTWSEVTSLHFMSRHVTSRHFTSCHVTSLHFTSLHFTSLYFVESSNGKISISWTEDRKWNLCCKVIPIKKCWRTINLWLCNASDKEFQFRQWRHLVSFPNSEI